MSNFTQYAQAALAILGAIYILLTTLGAIFPNTKFGQWCRTIAGDLKTLLATASPVFNPPVLGGSGAPTTTTTTSSTLPTSQEKKSE